MPRCSVKKEYLIQHTATFKGALHPKIKLHIFALTCCANPPFLCVRVAKS